MRQGSRRWLLLVLAIAACALLILAALHVRPARQLVLGRVLDLMRSTGGVELRVEDVSYNLLRLDASVHGVSARATGSSEPFATAESLRIDLPSSVLTGRFGIDAIEADGVVIRIVRDAAGHLNLPTSSGEGAATDRLDIGRVRLQRVDLSYADDANGVRVAADDVTLDLTPTGGVSSGWLHAEGGLSLRAGDVAVDGTLEGQLTYDGRSFRVTRLTSNSAVARLRVDGRVDVFGATPTLDLTAHASTQFEPLFTAFGLAPSLAGVVNVNARAQGPLASPTATIAASSDRVVWQHLVGDALSLQAHATMETLAVDAFTMHLAGGRVTGRGRLPFDTMRANAVVEASDVSAAALLGPDVTPTVGARLAGRLRLGADVGQGLTGLSANAQVTAARAHGRRDAIPLAGVLSLDVRGARWRVTHRHVVNDAVTVIGNLEGRVAPEPLNSTLGGTLEASTLDGDRIVDLARRAGIDVPAWGSPDGGRLDVKARLGGTLGAPTASGSVAIRDLRVAGSSAISGEVPFTADLRRVSIVRAGATVGGNTLTGDAALSLTSGALRGAFAIDMRDWTAFGPTVADLYPAGAIAAQVTLGGTRARPDVRATLTGSALEVARQQLGALSAQVAYAGQTVTADTIEIRQPAGGRLVASGRYDLDSDRYDVSLRADATQVSPITTMAGVWPVSAVVDGHLQARGTVERPDGGGRLTLTDLRWDDAHVARVDADIALSDAGVRATARVPTLAVALDGLVQPRAPYAFTATLNALDSPLEALRDSAGVSMSPLLDSLTGRIRMTAEARGTLADGFDTTTADLLAERLDVQSGDASLQLEEPASARYASSTLSVSALRLRSGSSRVEVTGTVDRASSTGLNVALQGDLADLRPWLAASGLTPEVDGNGAVALRVRARGSLERLILDGGGQVDDARVTWPGYPALTDVSVAFTLRDGVFDIPTVRARLEESVLAGSARVPLGVVRDVLPDAVTAALAGTGGPATLSAGISRITPATISSLTGYDFDGALTGRATLRVDLQASGTTLETLSGTATLSEFHATASGLPVDQVRPTRLELKAGTITVTDWTWNIAGSELAVGGRAALTGARALDLRVDGRLDLRVLGAVMPSVTTGGTGDVAIALRGTVDAPHAEGVVQFTDGELQLSDPRIGLTNGSGLLLLEPGEVTISRLEGVVNGGRLTGSGNVRHDGATLTGGSVSLQADDVGLDEPRGMRTVVDASLTAAFGERIQVSGRVDIVQGAYREPISLAATLASLAGQDSSTGTGTGAPSAATRMDLDVTVATATDLVIDNNYGRMDLGLDVRLVGTAAAPSVVGRATIREGGLIYLSGQTYIVERGEIDFSNPREIVPDVDIAARTRVKGLDETGAATEYDITLAVTGTPDTLDTTLSSNPARSQADIASLLATGRLSDQVGGMSGSLARDQILGYLSGEALGFAAHAIGLDSIRLERSAGQDLAMQTDPSIAGEVNPAQRLTIARRLSGNFEVTLSQNLRDTGRQTWVVTYNPVRRVEVRAISRDDRSRSYELRHDVSLGGPKPPTLDRPGSTVRHVAGIRFTGHRIVSDAELARIVSLEAGDRFDYRRWQRDRDRLRRFYLDRDYREVRIAARQLPESGDAGRPELTLEYDIDAGPLTAIEIEGHPLAAGAIEQLGTVWSDSIVDVALADELATLTRRLMAEDGYLGAEVHVTRVAAEEAAGTSRVRIRIVPGARTASRELRVTGHADVGEAEIETVVRRLGIDAWLAPTTAADAVALQYRERGLLAASVTAGPIETEGTTAVLPVRIVEGPRFVLGRILVSGARQRSADAVRADLGLSEGAPYAPADVERARASLTRAYARAGFNAMSATTETRIDSAAGAVDIEVRIDEGPRQVLDAVVVSGGEGVRASAIADALDLTPGAPVDLESWFAGRRRLSQTGLFTRIDIEPTPVARDASPDGTERVRADVMLVRRQPWRIRYGADVTDDEAPVASQGRVLGGGLNANIERFGLFGWPGSGSASLRYNRTQRLARGGVSWPSLFGQALATRLYLSRSRDLVEGENVLSFISDRTSVTAEQRLPLGRSTLVAWAYQFERNHVFDPEADPDDPFAIDERWQQARITSSLVFDTRDDPFEPRRGLLHSSNVEYGLEVLGRSGRFITYSLQQFAFLPLPRGLVSASAVRLNLGRGFEQDLIVSERFYAGGVNTVRGYPENALGGFDVFGDPIPGQAALVLNQEIRFPLYRWIGGAGFVDAGDVFPSVSDLSVRSLKFGAGAGLRVSTPVGLFRIDFAAPLPTEGRSPRWYFAFGHIF